MTLIYFFYGLAFFALGLTTSIYPKHRVNTWLARNFKFISIFGFLHGANEWLDMIEQVRPIPQLQVAATILSAVSFVSLLWFGVSGLAERGAPRIALAGFAVFPLGWVAIIVAASVMGPSASVVGRYILGIPSTWLTAIVLWLVGSAENNRFSRMLLQISATAFAVYGVATGFIGPEAPFWPASVLNQSVFLEWTGIPIQLVRTVLAGLLATSMTLLLRIFDVSITEQMQTEVRRSTAELQIANESLQNEIEDRRKREVALKESEARYRDLFENANDAIFIVDSDLRYVDVNKRAEELMGYTRGEFLSMGIVDLLPPDQVPRSRLEFEKLQNRQSYEHFVGKVVTKSGDHLDIEVSSSPIMQNGQVTGSRDIVRDITDRIQLEQQLLQAQKMEAVGQLAGGIAHDFNNILTAILGYADLLGSGEGTSDSRTEWLHSLTDAAKKAAGLTRNLLAFSRKQIMDLVPIDLNDVLRVARPLLASSIPEDVVLAIHESPDPVDVLADENQITQVLLNLVTNARDAMPSGGELTVSVSRLSVSEGEASEDLAPGAYGQLSVSDTGAGMSEETAEKIFEPFFTTKEVGKGTGLGLSTAYGIVKQHSGTVGVTSKLGQGTSVRVALPIRSGDKPDAQTSGEEKRHKGGNETILLAEDDDSVRTLIEHVLTGAGYRVLAAHNGEEAVELFSQNANTVDLAVLDVIMAGMNGVKVYDELLKIREDTTALFLTGYAADILKDKGIDHAGPRVVNKPVSPHALLSIVRETLDEV